MRKLEAALEHVDCGLDLAGRQDLQVETAAENPVVSGDHDGADIVAGAAWVLDAIDFDQRLRRARAVITGEGRLDTQTLEGKLLSEIARRCQAAHVPVHAIVGSCTLTADELAELALASLAQASDERELQRAAHELASTERVA